MNDYDVATAAFADALLHGRRSLTDVALEVGASAADQGVPLVEALDAVAAMNSGREPPYVAVRAVAEAWLGRATDLVIATDCHDELTSLASLAHLRSRLDDIYRQAAHRGGEPAVTHVLVVVELTGTVVQELEAALSALEVAHALEVAFPAHETVARLSSGRFAALTAAGDADPLGLAVLARVLEEALSEQPEARIWVERLPRDPDGLTWLVSRLSE